jgi:acyl carrier protein
VDVGDQEIESKITSLVLEYAVHAPPDRPLRPEFSLRDEIGLDSFALVSLMLRLGEEFDVDFLEESSRLGVSFQEISTFGDLVRLSRAAADLPR